MIIDEAAKERLRQAAAEVRALLDDAEARGERDVAGVMRQAADRMVRAVAREAGIEALRASGLFPAGARVAGGRVKRPDPLLITDP